MGDPADDVVYDSDDNGDADRVPFAELPAAPLPEAPLPEAPLPDALRPVAEGAGQ